VGAGGPGEEWDNVEAPKVPATMLYDFVGTWGRGGEGLGRGWGGEGLGRVEPLRVEIEEPKPRQCSPWRLNLWTL
jgi:hypothetical protein